MLYPDFVIVNTTLLVQGAVQDNPDVGSPTPVFQEIVASAGSMLLILIVELRVLVIVIGFVSCGEAGIKRLPL